MLHASMPSPKWSKMVKKNFAKIRFRPYTFIIRGLDFFFNFTDRIEGGKAFWKAFLKILSFVCACVTQKSVKKIKGSMFLDGYFWRICLNMS